MNTKLSTNREFKRMFANILSIFVILALAFPVMGTVYAEDALPPKVGLIATTAGIDDNSFNEMAYQGLLRAVNDLGVTISTYEPQDQSEYDSLMQQCADENELCIVAGFEFRFSLPNIARANPDIMWGIIEWSYPDCWEGALEGVDCGSFHEISNVRGLRFDEKQAGYLAGVLAGGMTASNTVGAVGGMEIPPVVAFVEGYRNGAQCTNPAVNVLTAYTGTFVDPELGATTAQEMIGQGADVIFGAAGLTGNGAILYSAQDGKWAIGVDTDQYLTVFGNGTVFGYDKLLSSAMKRVDNAVYQTIEGYVNGEFSSGTVVYDLANDGVGLAPFHEAKVPKRVKNELAAVQQGIIDGTIDINDPCSLPFVGDWRAIDIDGGDIRLSIGGKPTGPFQLTWTEEYFGYCGGGAGIARGTGWINADDPYLLEASLHLTCFTTGDEIDFYPVWRFNPATGWLTSRDDDYGGFVTTWHRPGESLPLMWRHVIAHPDENWVEGMGFPEGTVVSLLIRDADGMNLFAGTTVASYPDWDPYNTAARFFLDFDLKAGDHLWMSDGMVAKELIVTNLQITDTNFTTKSVSGIATPGGEVVIEYFPEGSEPVMFSVFADQDGFWTATVDDLVIGLPGLASEPDADGDLTRVTFIVPKMDLRVNYGHDWVESFYEAGHAVSLRVTDSEGNVKATAEVVTEPKDYWGGGTGFQSADSAWFDADGNQLESPPDVQPYDWVYAQVDNGATARVQIGEISGMIDLDANSVEGTILAPWITERVQVECLDWGSGREPPFDTILDGSILTDGSESYSCSWSEWDIQYYQNVGVGYFSPDGHWVANAFFVRNPHFTVFPEWEYIEGWEWPDGATVYASIEEKSGCSADGTAGYTGDPITFVQMWFPEGCDAVVGDVVTLTDNVTTRHHTVQSLAVTGVNADDDTVSGTADTGAQVHVWPHGYNELLSTADADGNWTADFTETGPDLVGGMAGRTEIRDEMGNATAVEWGVPGALFVTGTEDVIADDGVCTLREAVIAAKANAPSGEAIGECPAGSEFATDTILLAANQTYSLTISGSDEDGAYTGDLDILDNSAATDLIIMVDGNGKATISQDASVDDRVLENHGATVQIEGLTLTGGSNVEIGGGVHIAGGTLIMNVSTVSGNTANYGGGIYNDTSGTLVLAGSTISGNTANVDGGGLENGGSLTVDASTFTANSATYGGGALATYMGTVTIQNGSLFGGDPDAGQGNTANYGGGIAIWSGNLNLTDSTISGNTVSWVGGAIRNGSEGTVIIRTSTISNNFAEWDGGGILNEGAMTVDASEVLDNTATFQGGGIGNFEGDLTISASTVSGNSSGDGGGVKNWPNSTLVIGASTFAGNHAGGGGGLDNEGGTTTIQDGSQFTGNTVGWMGGAITNDSGGVLLVEGASIISGNSSDGFAGGLYNDSASTLTVHNSTITGNVSVYGGGGIMNEGTLIVDHSVLSANSSSQAGGALDNTGTATIINGTVIGGAGAEDANIAGGGGGLFNVGTMTVDASIVTGNQAGYGGGLFNWIGGMLTISNSTVSDNTANEGGGLHNKENSTTVIQNSVFSGNYAEFAGGGLQNWGTLIVMESVLLGNTSLGEGDAIISSVDAENATSITGSCIVDNGDTAVFNSLPAFQNFTSNWWGDASGPSGFGPGSGDSVSDYVDFSDWLTEPPAICAP